MQSSKGQSPGPDWVSIGRASELLGVNPATLRQWTSLGKVHAYRTPGGHRRFSSTEIANLSEAGSLQFDRVANDVIAQLRQRYHAVAHSVIKRDSSLADLSDEARERFHELGDALLQHLSDYLTAALPGDRRRGLAEARTIGLRYGQSCSASGLDTAGAVDAYLLFRRPFLDVLSAAMGTHPEHRKELSRIMRDAERFMDEVLASVANASEGSAHVGSGGQTA